ncbi:hypothetical protein [Geobacter sp. SVR]|uniref:hypothetical protein n=1 Tax=Geobacter sp. SVR TaxID=2495594 RepID=UPI00143F01DD|nr:hypothetical protein [Geobacter sp. SVR]BCS52085.1 hypothetical protein GSVR_03930 [Geobacter sp. SVR]GCF86540.1 hypothetical protein GSbR_31400 [Geobacter sp. SVR]
MGSSLRVKSNNSLNGNNPWYGVTVPENASLNVAHERIVEVTARAFSHFSENGSATPEYGKRLTRELMAHMSLLLVRKPEHVLCALEVLLDNYRYYCRRVKEWTLLDMTIEMLVKNSECHSPECVEIVSNIRALVERRALMALLAGPSA